MGTLVKTFYLGNKWTYLETKMWNWIKHLFIEYCECMRNVHLLDEAYIETRTDEKRHRGEW